MQIGAALINAREASEQHKVWKRKGGSQVANIAFTFLRDFMWDVEETLLKTRRSSKFWEEVKN